jgi:ABC-type uncharacterized transport system substrate-binding protein
VLAAKAATTTIPIVFEVASDPVKLGLVASLNRPGGNITGVTQLAEEVAPKRLELLHELLPSARLIALLVNPTDPVLAEPQTSTALSAARALGLDLHVLNASSEPDFALIEAIQAIEREGAAQAAAKDKAEANMPPMSDLEVARRIAFTLERGRWELLRQKEEPSASDEN